jgi:NADH-quinone oxidoreductase subunit J
MATAAFIVLSLLALVSGIVVISHRSAVISALALAFNLVAIAGLFLWLDAQFIAFLQVIVYAGAIMVLILFTIMLLNVEAEDRTRATGIVQVVLGPLLALAFALIVAFGAWSAAGGGRFPESAPGFGSVTSVGRELFTRYYYPFEAISLLLVVAMVGAVLLAKKRL